MNAAGRLAGRIAVIGFGNQGAAQAANLRDAGCRVVIGARPGGDSDRRAREEGFEVRAPAAAVAGASVVCVLLPDEVVPALWSELRAALDPAAAVLFAHGFNLLYGALEFPKQSDVALVSPTAPGRVLRQTFTRGERLPAYVAVHQDGSGTARATADSYADRIGCGPLWPTTVREETEVDLFGEQVVLCGGLEELVAAAFETLTRRGYAPEIAYLECVHQLKYLADLLHERGPTGFRRAISGTALFGDLTRGPRVIGPESRREMAAILEEIRSGSFAREWMAEVEAGSPRIASARSGGGALEQARHRALEAPDAEAGTSENRATPFPKTD